MNDLAIRACKFLVEQQIQKGSSGFSCSTNTDYCTDIAWEEVIKELCDVGKWIPVTERLPEKNGKYLVTYEKEFVPDHVDDVNHYKTIGILDYSKRFGWLMVSQESVYSWMTLPEPYKAESEG